MPRRFDGRSTSSRTSNLPWTGAVERVLRDDHRHPEQAASASTTRSRTTPAAKPCSIPARDLAGLATGGSRSAPTSSTPRCSRDNGQMRQEFEPRNPPEPPGGSTPDNSPRAILTAPRARARRPRLGALAVVPGMAALGRERLRYLPPAAWILARARRARARLPAAVEPACPPRVRRPGRAPPVAAAAAFGLATALLVLALPDRAHFVGDFLLRQGTVEIALAPGVLFPQALPLDVLLHYRIPLALGERAPARRRGLRRARSARSRRSRRVRSPSCWRARSGSRASRACALACARGVDRRARALMSGYSKAFSELALLTVAVAAFGTRVAREGRGVLGLLLACALGLALHRSALAFLPAAGVALALAFADPETRARLNARSALAGYAVLALALAVFLPQIVRTATSFESAQHFASEDVRRAGGLLAASFRPARLLDVLNLRVLLHAARPALVLVLLPKAGAREVLVVLALAWLLGALAFVLFPAQGAFRDWDVFAPAGVALAILAGALAARARGASGSRPCRSCCLVVLRCSRSRRRTTARARGGASRRSWRGRPSARRSSARRAGTTWARAGSRPGATPTPHARSAARRRPRARSASICSGRWRRTRRRTSRSPSACSRTWSRSRRAPRWRGSSSARSPGIVATTRRPSAPRAHCVKIAPDNAEVQQNARDVERAYAAWRDSMNTVLRNRLPDEIREFLHKERARHDPAGAELERARARRVVGVRVEAETRTLTSRSSSAMPRGSERSRTTRSGRSGSASTSASAAGKNLADRPASRASPSTRERSMTSGTKANNTAA